MKDVREYGKTEARTLKSWTDAHLIFPLLFLHTEWAFVRDVFLAINYLVLVNDWKWSWKPPLATNERWGEITAMTDATLRYDSIETEMYRSIFFFLLSHSRLVCPRSRSTEDFRERLYPEGGGYRRILNYTTMVQLDWSARPSHRRRHFESGVIKAPWRVFQNRMIILLRGRSRWCTW